MTERPAWTSLQFHGQSALATVARVQSLFRRDC